MRETVSLRINNPKEFILRAVELTGRYSHAAIYVSHNNIYGEGNKYSSFDALLTFDLLKELDTSLGIEGLSTQVKEYPDWYTGFLGYDLKNQVENLQSNNPDETDFPDMCFWVPAIVLKIREKTITGFYDPQVNTSKDVFRMVKEIESIPISKQPKANNIKLQPRITKENYMDDVHKLKQHIKRGDIYEINYCTEFFSNSIELSPAFVYQNMLKVSPTPFSVMLKMGDRYMFSASPERYLKKTGTQIVSQPIKGTIRRSRNVSIDRKLAHQLLHNLKEQTENVMIVDLVRNDLSRIAERDTVVVEELFGIYAFPQVYQMISTVAAKIPKDLMLQEIIKSTFPMGSMTGAPKVKAMQLIENYEHTRRGAFSGSVGYIDPSGDFDFNVSIRTILYNHERKYVSCSVGSAITDMADAETEYGECLLKLTAMERSLNQRD